MLVQQSILGKNIRVMLYPSEMGVIGGLARRIPEKPADLQDEPESTPPSILDEEQLSPLNSDEWVVENEDKEDGYNRQTTMDLVQQALGEMGQNIARQCMEIVREEYEKFLKEHNLSPENQVKVALTMSNVAAEKVNKILRPVLSKALEYTTVAVAVTGVGGIAEGYGDLPKRDISVPVLGDVYDAFHAAGQVAGAHGPSVNYDAPEENSYVPTTEYDAVRELRRQQVALAVQPYLVGSGYSLEQVIDKENGNWGRVFSQGGEFVLVLSPDSQGDQSQFNREEVARSINKALAEYGLEAKQQDIFIDPNGDMTDFNDPSVGNLGFLVGDIN